MREKSCLKIGNMNLAVKLFVYVYIFIYLSTIFLSWLHGLNRGNLCILYFVFVIFMVARYGQAILQSISKPLKIDKVYVFAAVVLGLTFVQGLFSAPGTTDSMVYHLPRVMYWVQEKTVFQNVIRNPHDFMPPFAEYILLHLYLLAGNDRLLFLSQWLNYLSIIFLSGLLAISLGADKRSRDRVVMLVAVMPILLLQSVSTQTDLLTAGLILVTFYLVLRILKKAEVGDGVMLGFVLGLGMLAKPTFAIFMTVPLGTLLLVGIRDLRKLLPLFFIAALVSGAIQLPYYFQNEKLYGNILGQNITKKDNVFTNSVFTASSVLSNSIKNIFINLPVPVYTDQVNGVLASFHKFLGIGINDRRTTFSDTSFGVSRVLYPQEDIVGNPFHILLILSVLLLIFRKNLAISGKSIVRVVYLLTLISFFLFSAVLKWQPFHSRLLIPFYLLGTIAAGLVLSNNKYGRLLLSLCLWLSVPLAFLLIILNVSKPYVSYTGFFKYIQPFVPSGTYVPQAFYLTPRTKQYFNARWYWYDPYNSVVDLVAGEKGECTLSFNLIDGFEYPLWILMKNKGVNCKVITGNEMSGSTQIITTSPSIFADMRYNTTCYKTLNNYGYACLSKTGRAF